MARRMEEIRQEAQALLDSYTQNGTMDKTRFQRMLQDMDDLMSGGIDFKEIVEMKVYLSPMGMAMCSTPIRPITGILV